MTIPEHLLNATEAIALAYDGEHAPHVSASGEYDLAQAIISVAIAHAQELGLGNGRCCRSLWRRLVQ